MIELLRLCFEFFKTGLFAVGGGMSTLPFLSAMADKYPHWFTQEMLANMVAVSESTPGPIGVNMATYVGYTVAGVPGALAATLSLMLPSIAVILIIARVLDRFRSSKLVADSFEALRPAVTGLIAAAGWAVLRLSLFTTTAWGSLAEFLGAISIPSVIIFAACVFFSQWKKTAKLHPLVYIAVGAALGVILKL